MVRSGVVAFTTLAISIHSVAEWLGPDVHLGDPGLNLLQLKVQKALSNQTAYATTRSSISPGGRERELCPHEMTEAQGTSDISFGCRGTLRAEAIKECSFWGEPHVSKTFPSQDMKLFDVLYTPGLFRMAAADDGSWEVQVQNCGNWAGAVAVRFGKHVLEVVAPARDVRGDQWNNQVSLMYFLDGEEYNGEFPIEKGQLFVDNTHRNAKSNTGKLDETSTGGRGACADDPNGQFYLDIYKGAFGNIGVLMQVKDGSWTTADGQASLCNVERRTLNRARYYDWPVDLVQPEDSLFIAAGSKACEFCESIGWEKSLNTRNGFDHKADAQASCAARAPKEFSTFTVDSMCQQKGISLESARAACVHLKDDTTFFTDCQLDFCAADGSPGAVEDAEEEEHAENPQPVCAVADDECDPAAACCSALKDNAILDFSKVLQNNLCGDGVGARELRFGSVLTQKGQVMDLVVTPEEGHSCGSATNGKNGAKSADIGRIGVQAGTDATFNFAFVKGSTNIPATPTSLMFSFFDIDQGKKGKQRESVEVCGAVNAIVTDNSELEQSNHGNCIKFTSTTHGTGKDNPDSSESLSDSQRARTVAFQIAGSSFQATLGVSKKGRNPRRFMFAGNPSVACVLK